MRNVSRKTRIGFALLAALGMMVAPSTACAGKFNLAGGGSRVSSGAAARFVAPQPAMSMKSNVSSNLGSAAKFNAGPKFNAAPKISAMPKFNTAGKLSTMPKLSSSQLSSSILGKSANNTTGRMLSRA